MSAFTEIKTPQMRDMECLIDTVLELIGATRASVLVAEAGKTVTMIGYSTGYKQQMAAVIQAKKYHANGFEMTSDIGIRSDGNGSYSIVMDDYHTLYKSGTLAADKVMPKYIDRSFQQQAAKHRQTLQKTVRPDGKIVYQFVKMC